MADDLIVLTATHAVNGGELMKGRRAVQGHVEPVGPGAVDDRFALGTCRYLSPAPSHWAAPRGDWEPASWCAVIQSSTCSEIARASSTSMPR